MQYTKTDAGQAAFKARSELFSVRQRSAFLLFDGVKSVEQILKMTSAIGISQADIDALTQHGFIGSAGSALTAPSAAATPSSGAAPALMAAEQAQPQAASNQQRFTKAWPLATQLTAGLGLRGFRLNLSIERASGYDDLLKLLPSIQQAVGSEKCAALERALKF